MTKEEREAVALFRYGLIAPILNKHCDRQPYLQEICALKHTVPYYGLKEFSLSTVERWLSDYRKWGFEGLKPKIRDDKGQTRALCVETQDTVLELRRKNMHLSTASFYKLCSKNHVKVVSRHVWEEYMEMAEDVRHSPQGKEAYSMRGQTIERVFADAKEKHFMRYTYYRGLAKLRMQALLTFACMNLKKLAKWKKQGGLLPDFCAYFFISTENASKSFVLHKFRPDLDNPNRALSVA